MNALQALQARRRPSRSVRRHARRVALTATVVGLVVYLGAGAVADLVANAHLEGEVDARLAARLMALAKTIPAGGVPSPTVNALRLAPHASVSQKGDLDDAPIFAWWIPEGSGAVIALQSGDLLLTRAARAEPVLNEAVSGHAFRLHSLMLTKGTLVVGTSIAALAANRTTLLVLEGSLLPVVLLLLYLIATFIGRGAATPIERARQEQLDFTADASHELRTPLAVIEAEVGLALAARRPAADYRLSLERVAGETKRLRSIVDDLLWLARLDSLPEPPLQEVVDLGTLAEGAASRFRSIAEARSISLRYVPDTADGPFVLGPADWLDRLISVLLDNACRYSTSGGAIEVATRSELGRSILVVDDSGPGLQEAEIEDVVRRFHRATAAPGGAGLGLSIADTIVRGTDATWQISRSPAGGARIEVSWAVPRRVTE
jgi:signal transduction histidine kinase